MMFEVSLKKGSIAVLIVLMLLPGCGLFNPFPVDLETETEHVATENEKGKVYTTEELPIRKLKRLAHLMSSRYAAAMRNDVKEQRAFQNAIIALLAASSGAVLFDANSDLIKALMFSAGVVYVYGETGSNSQRRKIFNAAANAYECIAFRLGAIVPGNSTLGFYVQEMEKIDVSVRKMRKQFENFNKAAETDPATGKVEAIRGVMEKIFQGVQQKRIRARSVVNSLAWTEEVALNDIVSLDRTIAYELARLEPDFADFVQSVQGSISKWQGLASTAALKSGGTTGGNGTSGDLSTTFETSWEAIAARKETPVSDGVEKAAKGFNETLDEFEKAYGELDIDMVRKELDEGYARAEEMPKDCWQYAQVQTSGVTAEPVSPVLAGAKDTEGSVIITGLKGDAKADVLDGATNSLGAKYYSHSGKRGVLVLRVKSEDKKKREVRVLVADDQGASVILKVLIEAHKAGQ